MTNNEIKLELAKIALPCGMPVKAAEDFYNWIMEEPEQKVSDEKQIQLDDTPIEELPESEDERIRKTLLKTFKSFGADGTFWTETLQICKEDVIAWLEKQNHEWSEGDKKMISLLISIFEVNLPDGYFKKGSQCIHSFEIIKWLKSLNSQNRRKPSEEQLKALEKG